MRKCVLVLGVFHGSMSFSSITKNMAILTDFRGRAKCRRAFQSIQIYKLTFETFKASIVAMIPLIFWHLECQVESKAIQICTRKAWRILFVAKAARQVKSSLYTLHTEIDFVVLKKRISTIKNLKNPPMSLNWTSRIHPSLDGLRQVDGLFQQHLVHGRHLRELGVFDSLRGKDSGKWSQGFQPCHALVFSLASHRVIA